MKPASTTDSIVEEITIVAPADRVFEALVDPAQRVQWWGAEGRFQTTRMESDTRPGGRWAMHGIGMNGQPFTVRGEYREVRRPTLLEFTWLPDWQPDATVSLVRIELSERDGATFVRLTHSGLTSEASRASHRGWPQVLAWLEAYATGADGEPAQVPR